MFRLFKPKKKFDSNANNENVEGAWVFVSHSNKDWKSVKEVRDYLESKGHKPLLFYLKCLEEATEINDLILREIEARNWFILCESENSKNSKWVQTEVDYIKQLKGKVYETINLNNPLGIKKEFYKLDRLSKRLSVYVSYSHKDNDIAQVFINKFKDNDYKVFKHVEIKPGQKFVSTIRKSIDESIEHGFFIMLITENSFRSGHVKSEIEYALNQGVTNSYKRNILPISFLSMEKLQHEIPVKLLSIQMADFSKGLIEDNLNKLIEDLKTRKMD